MNGIRLFFLWQIAFHTHSVHSARIESSSSDAPEIEGFTKNSKSKCKTSTMSQSVNRSSTHDSCRLACDAARHCACFQVEHHACRIGTGKSSKTVKGGKATAYSRTERLVELSVVNSMEELPATCRYEQKVKKKSDCSTYFSCVEGAWEEIACPQGLAYDSAREMCDWPTAVPGCSDAIIGSLSEFTCHGQHFEVAPNPDQPEEILESADAAVQVWLKSEIAEWRSAAGKLGSMRPEHAAAVNILRVVATELSVMKKHHNGEHIHLEAKRIAVLTPATDTSGPVMQSVALVGQKENVIDIMGIVSRRSLLNDDNAVSGSGKALAGAILLNIHKEFPEKPVVLYGTPGDKFVEELYKKHGMKEVGRHENGMPELRMEIPAECVDFMVHAILCKDTEMQDYAAMAWSVIPGSEHVKRVCAHVMPSSLYLSHLTKMLIGAH